MIQLNIYYLYVGQMIWYIQTSKLNITTSGRGQGMYGRTKLCTWAQVNAMYLNLISPKSMKASLVNLYSYVHAEHVRTRDLNQLSRCFKVPAWCSWIFTYTDIKLVLPTLSHDYYSGITYCCNSRTKLILGSSSTLCHSVRTHTVARDTSHSFFEVIFHEWQINDNV